MSLMIICEFNNYFIYLMIFISLMITCEFNDFVVFSSMVIDGTRPLE